MRAIVISRPGAAEVLRFEEVAEPVPGPGEVLLDVAATAVNRADLMQRQGLYPPPPGASPILGLECSGVVAQLGAEVGGLEIGQPVCALLAGGGYAERVAVPAAQVMPLPAGVSLVDSAALPEVAATVWSMVVQGAGLARGEVFLVHGGSSGIGTHALQVARALGARPFATAGSPTKLARCRELGAEEAINYRDEDFVTRLRELTGGHGADVVLDNMGASYLARNLDVLADDGRLVVIGLQGGRAGEVDLAALLARRATVRAAGLRARPAAQKAEICRDIVARLWPLIAAGTVRPVIDQVLPLEEAARAHTIVEASEHVGKVLLATDWGRIRT